MDETDLNRTLVGLQRRAMEERVFGVDDRQNSVAAFIRTREFQDIMKQVNEEDMEKMKAIYSIFIISSAKNTEAVSEFIDKVQWTSADKNLFDHVSNAEWLTAWKDMADTESDTEGETAMGDVVANLFSDLKTESGPSMGGSPAVASKKGITAQISPIDPGDGFVHESGALARTVLNQAQKAGQMTLSLRFVEAPKPILPNPVNAMVKEAQRNQDPEKIQDMIAAVAGKDPEYLGPVMDRLEPVLVKIANKPYEAKKQEEKRHHESPHPKGFS